MELKYKIIGIVFAILFFTYFGYYLAQLAKQNDTKKEHYEDVKPQPQKVVQKSVPEKTPTQDAVKSSGPTDEKKDEYDQRIRIIDAIEKLTIADKNIKSKLTEVLLADLKETSNMSDTDLSKFVQMKYEIVKNDLFASKIAAGDGIKEIMKSGIEEKTTTKVENFDVTVLEQANKIIDNLDDTKKRILQIKDAFIKTPQIPSLEKFENNKKTKQTNYMENTIEDFYQGYDYAKQNKFAQFRQ